MKKCIILIVMILVPLTTVAKPKEKTFQAPVELVWEAVLRAAQSNFTVVELNGYARMLKVRDGGISAPGMIGIVSVNRKNKTESVVKIETQLQGQLVGWGAGGRMAKKLFESTETELGILIGGRAQGAHVESKDPRIQEFQSLRKDLIGYNFEAAISLSAWLADGDSLLFPPGRNLPPGQLGTITDIWVCKGYPLPDDNLDWCRRDPEPGFEILVLLINGAQLRPSPPQANVSGISEALASLSSSLSCTFGPALDCIQHRQRQQSRELSKAREEAEIRARMERFLESGPEIVFRLPTYEEADSMESTTASFRKDVMAILKRFIKLEMRQ